MAKKRKVSSQSLSQPKRNSAKAENSKLNINTYEDVADSEDEFLINRDKVLLDEGPETKRRRQIREDEQLLEASDEEVLALPTSDDEDVDDDELEEPVDESMGEASISEGFSKRLGGISEDLQQAEDEEDEELGGWGDSRQDYYGADVIDTEQAALEEEAEAKRLQQKHLQAMADADFGLGDDAWEDESAEEEGAEGYDGVVTEVLPQLQISEDLSAEERLKLLKTRYPEFEHIAKEFTELQALHEDLMNAARRASDLLQRMAVTKSKIGKVSPTTHPAIVKHQALSAYLGTAAMYFAVLTSTADGKVDTLAKSPLELRDHPIMDSLVQNRQLWNQVKDLEIPDPAAELATLIKLSTIQEEAPKPTIKADKTGLKASKKVKKAIKKTAVELEAETAQVEAEARRGERMRKMEKELASLSALTSKTGRKTTKPNSQTPAHLATNEAGSDIGDETELTAHELAEKAKRKKTLKFYTAQITQKANKRGAAGKDAGGDMDIPYRERLKDRQARLNAQAEERGKKGKQPGEELGVESDDDDARQAKQIRGEDGTDDEDYYDMVAARSKQKKASKREAAEAYARAAQEGGKVYEVEEVGPDGKRKISYQIEKNKGLTPHRKKDVRNPRVKKRKKFEEKKKKLGSIRAVYKGGEGKGGYKGELSGIKTNLVKGIKL